MRPRPDEKHVAPEPGAPGHDSTGYQALVALDDDSDAVWRYRVLFGWEVRDFAATLFPPHQAPIAEAELIWSPSGLTTITASLNRSIEDAAREVSRGTRSPASRAPAC
jgi:hypothetical protein